MPVSEWIQPGSPHDFRSYSLLTKGPGRDSNGQLWGPLCPFSDWRDSLRQLQVRTRHWHWHWHWICAPNQGEGRRDHDGLKLGHVLERHPRRRLPVQQRRRQRCFGEDRLRQQGRYHITNNLSMISTCKGLWKYTGSKIKQPNTGSVVCKSGLGGSASR
ncbi:hypothetical protein CGRA01v4_01674 [Colletotrichum graminicola]|nr:hypothetical protein CGRA01v4_01674 [Colletotrichum graminicola]